MTLDETNPPITIEAAVDHGRHEALSELEALARREAEQGDSRALNVLTRLLKLAGYRR